MQVYAGREHEVQRLAVADRAAEMRWWRRSTVAELGAGTCVVDVDQPGRRITAGVLSVQGGGAADDAARRHTGPA